MGRDKALPLGHWQVSWGGRSAWSALGAGTRPSLDLMLVGDFDGDRHADVIQRADATPEAARP